MDHLSTDTLISPSKDLVASDIDGEVMLVSIDAGAYVGLNEIGSAIWRAMASPVRFGDLVRTLQDQFSGDPATIERETRAFVLRLLDRKLAQISQPAAQQ